MQISPALAYRQFFLHSALHIANPKHVCACARTPTLHCWLAPRPFHFSIFYGRRELLGDKGREASRLVDAEKRDQEGNKKLATRGLLLGDGLTKVRQARELVSGTHTHRAPAAKKRKLTVSRSCCWLPPYSQEF